jgi:hypothetical protein
MDPIIESIGWSRLERPRQTNFHAVPTSGAAEDSTGRDSRSHDRSAHVQRGGGSTSTECSNFPVNAPVGHSGCAASTDLADAGRSPTGSRSVSSISTTRMMGLSGLVGDPPTRQSRRGRRLPLRSASSRRRVRGFEKVGWQLVAFRQRDPHAALPKAGEPATTRAMRARLPQSGPRPAPTSRTGLGARAGSVPRDGGTVRRSR